MSFYQFLVPILAIIMIMAGASRYGRGERTVREIIIWDIVWGGLSLISLYPRVIIKFIERATGIKSGINALIFFFLIVLLYAVLRLFIRIEKVEQDLTKLVRRDALEKYRAKKEASK